MSVKPVLIVLYTNDAVEVRYSDQCRLHVLPCGTSFTFHKQTDMHPVHGMSTIQQRSSFVTSHYRNQLIAAIDFRNRFAERPFLCSDPIDKDEIVIEIEWEKIEAKIEMEYQKERERLERPVSTTTQEGGGVGRGMGSRQSVKT